MDQVLTEEVSPGPGGVGESPISRIRPRVRRDVVFAQTSDGAFLRHAESGFVMKGRTAYQWISALLPHFTGENTVAELCSGLSSEQQELIGSMVSVLLERGFVRDFTAPPGDDLTGPVAERYQGQLEFIEHYARDARARFARFRASRVLVAGEGPSSVAAAESLLRNGLEQVAVQLDPCAARADLARLTTEARAASEAGAAASVSQLREPLSSLSAQQLGEYDVIVVFADQGRAADAVNLARRLPDGPALLPVTVVGHRAVLGPLTRAAAAPCLICLLLRLGANLPPAEMADLWRGASLPGLPVPSALGRDMSARMIGNAAAFDVFRWRTGTLPAETDRAAVIQDLETLDTVRERLLPHPLCPSCRLHQDGEAVLLPGSLTAEQQLQRLLWPVAAHVGVFSGFEDGQIDQSPLKVGQVRLGSADFAKRAGRTITAFDLNPPAEARERALYQATQVYADQVADQARGVATPPAEGRVVRPETLHNWAGVTLAEPFTRWIAATSFPAGELCFLPAEAVSPAAQGAAGRYFEVTPAGRGAGPDRARAVTAGLGSALAY
ncbi:MAG: TOMM precursor leader peptide-binding protein, partial [Nocardiopsaceae bacterium]|nr:TOMM precursor leader peptide-binding protein [Nocardiopsaceae bacterium]